MDRLEKKAVSLLSALLFVFVLTVISLDIFYPSQIGGDGEDGGASDGNMITGAATTPLCTVYNTALQETCYCKDGDIIPCPAGRMCKKTAPDTAATCDVVLPPIPTPALRCGPEVPAPASGCSCVFGERGEQLENCVAGQLCDAATGCKTPGAADTDATSEARRTGTRTAPTPPTVSGTPVADNIRPNACEMHIGFRFDTAEMAEQSDSAAVGIAALGSGEGAVTQFLERVAAGAGSKQIYVHGFTSWEGSASYNRQLAQRRVDAAVAIIREYIASHPNSGISVSQGTINARSEIFWGLTAEDKTAINRFRNRATGEQRAAVLNPIPALSENRRVILTSGTSDYSIVQISGGTRFLDAGCPAPTTTPAAQCGNGQVDSGEDCDTTGTLTTCKGETGSFSCGAPGTPNACRCSKGAAAATICIVNGRRDFGEQCDPDEEASSCASGQSCNPQCVCAAGGAGGGIINRAASVCGWWCWLLIGILPFLALVIIPIKYKTRRTQGLKRAVAGDVNKIADRNSIEGFIEELVRSKEELIRSIRITEEQIAELDPALTKKFTDYLKTFRDVAYLRDPTSPESKSLEEMTKGLLGQAFERYLGLIAELLELEKLEHTLLMLVSKLENEIVEQRRSGSSALLQQFGAATDDASLRQLELVLTRLKQETREIISELQKIENTVEEHVREQGILLSGIVSMFGKGRAQRKLAAKYSPEELERIWWIRKSFSWNAPIGIRREGMIRTPERHIWPYRTKSNNRWLIMFNKLTKFGKWHPDEQITTSNAATPELAQAENEWRQKLQQIKGAPISAQSAYVQKIGIDVIKNLRKDRHIIANLFTMVDAGGKQLGVEGTKRVSGNDPIDLGKQNIRYSGRLRNEIDLLAGLHSMLNLDPNRFPTQIVRSLTSHQGTISGKVVDAHNPANGISDAEVWVHQRRYRGSPAHGDEPRIPHVWTNHAGEFSIKSRYFGYDIEVHAEKNGEQAEHTALAGNPNDNIPYCPPDVKDVVIPLGDVTAIGTGGGIGGGGAPGSSPGGTGGGAGTGAAGGGTTAGGGTGAGGTTGLTGTPPSTGTTTPPRDSEDINWRRLGRQVVKWSGMNLLVGIIPFGFPARTIYRIFRNKEYREYVRKKAPDIFKVCAKAIATEGASLSEPGNLRVIYEVLKDDPSAPPELRKLLKKVENNWAVKKLLERLKQKLGEGAAEGRLPESDEDWMAVAVQVDENINLGPLGKALAKPISKKPMREYLLSNGRTKPIMEQIAKTNGQNLVDDPEQLYTILSLENDAKAPQDLRKWLKLARETKRAKEILAKLGTAYAQAIPEPADSGAKVIDLTSRIASGAKKSEDTFEMPKNPKEIFTLSIEVSRNSGLSGMSAIMRDKNSWNYLFNNESTKSIFKELVRTKGNSIVQHPEGLMVLLQATEDKAMPKSLRDELVRIGKSKEAQALLAKIKSAA